jgi:hypothetical protein
MIRRNSSSELPVSHELAYVDQTTILSGKAIVALKMYLLSFMP